MLDVNMNNGSEEEVNLEQKHEKMGHTFSQITLGTGVIYTRLQDFLAKLKISYYNDSKTHFTFLKLSTN